MLAAHFFAVSGGGPRGYAYAYARVRALSARAAHGLRPRSRPRGRRRHGRRSCARGGDRPAARRRFGGGGRGRGRGGIDRREQGQPDPGLASERLSTPCHCAAGFWSGILSGNNAPFVSVPTGTAGCFCFAKQSTGRTERVPPIVARPLRCAARGIIGRGQWENGQAQRHGRLLIGHWYIIYQTHRIRTS